MKTGLIILIFLGGLRAQTGLDLCLQRPFSGSSAGTTGIASLSYYTPSWHRLAGFTEYGAVGMPSLGFREEDILDHRRTLSFIGLFGGHLFLLKGGLLRAGFSLGTVWEETARPEWIPDTVTDAYIRRNVLDSKFTPYFALKFQVLLFSFIISNKGAGGGLNFTL